MLNRILIPGSHFHHEQYMTGAFAASSPLIVEQVSPKLVESLYTLVPSQVPSKSQHVAVEAKLSFKSFMIFSSRI